MCSRNNYMRQSGATTTNGNIICGTCKLKIFNWICARVLVWLRVWLYVILRCSLIPHIVAQIGIFDCDVTNIIFILIAYTFLLGIIKIKIVIAIACLTRCSVTSALLIALRMTERELEFKIISTFRHRCDAQC